MGTRVRTSLNPRRVVTDSSMMMTASTAAVAGTAATTTLSSNPATAAAVADPYPYFSVGGRSTSVSGAAGSGALRESRTSRAVARADAARPASSSSPRSRAPSSEAAASASVEAVTLVVLGSAAAPTEASSGAGVFSVPPSCEDPVSPWTLEAACAPSSRWARSVTFSVEKRSSSARSSSVSR